MLGQFDFFLGEHLKTDVLHMLMNVQADPLQGAFSLRDLQLMNPGLVHKPEDKTES